jgi:hypothetical protein
VAPPGPLLAVANWNKVGEGVSEVSGGVAPQNLAGGETY